MDLSKRDLVKTGKFLLIPFILLSIFLVSLSVNKRTIAPLDIYELFEPKYQAGNAKLVKNSYLYDLVTIYLPWKYYISQHKPATCNMDLTVKGRLVTLSGVSLPQGDCYPIDAVRANLYFDSLYFSASYIDFFDAYNFSYYLFYLFLFVSTALLFYLICQRKVNIPLERSFLPAMLTVAFCASFPVAREFQYDGPIAGIPYLLLAMACGYIYLFVVNFEGRNSLWNRVVLLTLLSVFVSIAIIKGTLQCLAIYPLFLVFAIALFWLNSRKTLYEAFPIAISIGFGILPALAHYQESIYLFLRGADSFVPVKDVSLATIYFNRLAALLFSFGGAVVGDLFFSFNTIDFSKIVGDLGTREKYSYDGVAFFSHIIILIVAISSARGFHDKTVLKRMLYLYAGFLFLTIFTPIHRLVYFRLHQWSSLFFVLSLVLLNRKPINWLQVRNLTIYGLSAVIVLCLGAYTISVPLQGLILETVEGVRMGSLDFEEGIWSARLSAWQSRVHFVDSYGLVYLVGSILMLAFIMRIEKRPFQYGFLAVLVLSMWAMNVFHYNSIHDTSIFYSFLESIEGKDGISTSSHPYFAPENLKLLVNEAAHSIYESLAIKGR